MRSIINGMPLNADGKHVDFIEVHSADVKSKDLQPVLEWAASQFNDELPLNVIMTPQIQLQPGGPIRKPGPVKSIAVNVTFSEPVANFTASDLVVSKGGVINSFLPPDTSNGSDNTVGSTYSFTLSGPTNGSPTTVDIRANTVSDSNGNENTAAPQFSFTFQSRSKKPAPPPPIKKPPLPPPGKGGSTIH